jgi:hypothetical protein
VPDAPSPRVAAIDREGRTMWIADAPRDGKRFVVRADEKLTAFLELERVTRENLMISGPAIQPAATCAAGASAEVCG